MRVPEPLVLDADWVFEQVVCREILRTARRVLSSKEYDALLDFAKKPRRHPSRRVERAIQKVRVAMGVE